MPKLLKTFLFFILSLPISAQDEQLADKTYEELRTLFLNTENDSLAKIYAESYLLKAKPTGDSSKIGRGYKLMANAHYGEVSIAYSDSILLYTKNLKDDFYYPAVGYYLKGAWLSELGKFKEGLDNLIIAQDYASKQNNEAQLSEIRLAIASLRDEFGDHDEALEIYLEELDKVKSKEDFLKNYRDDYYINIYNVIDGYLDTKKPDSAFVYINEAFDHVSVEDSDYYPDFLSLMGYTLFYSEKYEQALDSLNKAIPLRKDYGLSVSYYYKGACLEKLGKRQSAIKYYIKTDSIYNLTKEPFPKLLDIYNKLIDDARAKAHVENQVYYVNRLLEVDSILDKNYTYLSKQVTKNYDTKLLLDEKNRIIQKQEQKRKTTIIYAIALITFISLVLTFLHFKRTKNIRRRFESIIEKLNENKQNLKEKGTQTIEVKTKKELGVPDDVVKIVLQKLDVFENKKLYLGKDCSLANVAKKLQTNSSYLSKIVNNYKENSFNSYINNLRIDYVLSKLQDDQRFRKYTISAIADEAGYNNAQSFGNAFFKQTSMKPSTFIKQLSK